MSDIEEYFSNESDSENSDFSDNDDNDKIEIKKPIVSGSTIEISDDENDKKPNNYYDEDEEEEDEEEDVHIGGAPSEDEFEDENEDDDDDDDNEDKIISSNKIKKTSKITIDPILDEDEIEDEDEDEDENYLQKFDNEISKNYISEQHPECAIHNYDEISKLSIIVKDNDGIIIDPLHKTLPFLTKYEKTRVLGQRTKQIECGAIPFIKVPEGIIDAHIIADLELQEKKIPFIIRRPIPGGGSEYWNLNDLEIISF